MLKYTTDSCDCTPAVRDVALRLTRDANPDAAHLLYGRPSPASRTAGRLGRHTILAIRKVAK